MHRRSTAAKPFKGRRRAKFAQVGAQIASGVKQAFAAAPRMIVLFTAVWMGLLPVAAALSQRAAAQIVTPLISIIGSTTQFLDTQNGQNATLVPGDIVNAVLSGAPGATATLVVGGAFVQSFTVGASGATTQTYVIQSNYDGASFVSTQGGSVADPFNFQVEAFSGAASGAADGDAAADQVDAALDQFLPGLNANSDLTQVFGLPGAPAGFPIAAPIGIGNFAPPPGGGDVDPPAGGGGQVNQALQDCLDRVAELKAQLAALRAQILDLVRQIRILENPTEEQLREFFLDQQTFLGENPDAPERASDLVIRLRGFEAELAQLRAQNPGLEGQNQADLVAELQAAQDSAPEEFRELVLSEALENAATPVGATAGGTIAVGLAIDISAIVFEGSVAAVAASSGFITPTAVLVGLGAGVGLLALVAVGVLIFNAVNDNSAEVEAALQRIRSATQRLATFARIAQLREAIPNIRAQIEAERQSRIQALRAALQAQLAQLQREEVSLEARIRLEEARCRDLERRNGSILPPPGAQDFAFASARYSLDDLRAAGSETVWRWDSRLNVWVKADATLHRDGRRDIGQDGQTFAAVLGASYQVHPGVALGVAGRFGRTDLSGAPGETEANTLSVAAFAQADVVEDLRLEVIGAYTRSAVDASFNQNGVTTNGDLDVDSFAAQAKLSRSFDAWGYTVTPALGATYVYVDQESFRLSDGTVAPERTDSRFTLTGGPTVARTFVLADGETLVTPSLSLTGFFNLAGSDDLVRFDGSRVDGARFGAAATAGVSIAARGGVSVGLNGTLSAFDSDQFGYGLSGVVTIPLN